MSYPEKLILIATSFLIIACSSPGKIPAGFENDKIKIESLTNNVFIHISYLNIPNYGNFPCNGMIYRNGKKIMVFDTPTTGEATQELLSWIDRNLSGRVVAVVVNHFHNDCLGGLDVFHLRNIMSYANNATIRLAEENHETVPKAGFESLQELVLGNKKVINQFFGEGHTTDNIVSYLPEEKILFGGCLIKEMQAGKGNLADANVDEWPATVRRIKAKYPDIRFVIPGHGKPGGMELLDYTIELFKR